MSPLLDKPGLCGGRLSIARRLACDGSENDAGDLSRPLVEREVHRVGDRDSGDLGTFFEHVSFLVNEPDVVMLAEHDAGRDARIAESRGE
jgi:hypothetical protein